MVHSIVLRSLVAVCVLPCAAAGPDDFFRAIRADQLKELAELIKDGSVNQPDSRGTTPLHYAAGFGSVESLRLLLDGGGDVRARNSMGATPLVLAAQSPVKVPLLLAAGADATARTKAGRTPLLIAAGRSGSFETVRLLVEAGAEVNGADDNGATPLNAAADSGDLECVRFLIARGAHVNAADKDGFTPLMGALAFHEVERTRLLLKAGAEVNAANTSGAQVRHGPVALIGLTPLILASAGGPPEVVEALLAAGAKVNVRDGRGLTPLLAAVSSEHQDPRVLKALIAAGADVNAKDTNGDSVLDWARKFGYPSTLHLLEAAGAKGSPPAQGPVRTGPPAEASKAVLQAIALLQRSSSGFFNESGCVACHHQPAAVAAEVAVRNAGLPVSDAAKQEQIRGVGASRALEPRLLQFEDPGGKVDTVGSVLQGLAAADVQANSLTDAGVSYIAGKQALSGEWSGFGISRAPIEGSDITRTALAIQALRYYGWPARKPEFDQRIARARRWLLNVRPETSYERAALLFGLHRSGAAAQDLARVATGLLAEQRPGGGWSQNPNLGSDAYATGLALYSLRETGQLKPSDPAYRRGVEYLLRTQLDDGSWYVRSRAPKFQPYFQSGFPHDHDQWISAISTAYAVMAIAPAVPKSPLSQIH